MTLHTLNNKRDKPDSRDFLLEKHFKLKSFRLPKWIDLRINSGCPEILHQGKLGSCTACGFSNALRFILRKNGEKEFQPSRLFIYYFTRVIEDTVDEDVGVEIRNALKAIKRNGVCSEIELPYDIENFTNKPSEYAIQSAKNQGLKAGVYLNDVAAAEYWLDYNLDFYALSIDYKILAQAYRASFKNWVQITSKT